MKTSNEKFQWKVLQGNAAVLSILHSFKGLISSERNFPRAITQTAMFIFKQWKFLFTKSIFELVH